MAISKPTVKKKKVIDATPIADNLEKKSPTQMVNMNFKVPYEYRKEFLQFALAHDISGVELLRRSFDGYRKNSLIK